MKIKRKYSTTPVNLVIKIEKQLNGATLYTY